MIIRNHKSTLIMIEQDHHAHVSKDIIQQWEESFLADDPLASSVLYAIQHHDCGWRLFDKQPFWNDATNMPHAFTDFPTLPKTVLYTKGIDEVEAVDPYAAALCSVHYMKFMSTSDAPEARIFLEEEETRVQRIREAYPLVDKDTFDRHVAILQFADNISLYLCLNDPGIKPENVHAFFKHGIAISTNIRGIAQETIDACWPNQQTVVLKGLPYVKPFTVTVQQKNVSKKAINEQGIVKSYEQAPYEDVDIQLIVE